MKSNQAKAVGRRLRETRERLGWERGELADRLGVHPGSIARWETGGSVPQPYHLERVAEWAGVSVEWLREGEGAGPPEAVGARVARGVRGVAAGAVRTADEAEAEDLFGGFDRIARFLGGIGPAGEGEPKLRKLDALEGYRRMITASGRALPDYWFRLKGMVERDEL